MANSSSKILDRVSLSGVVFDMDTVHTLASLPDDELLKRSLLEPDAFEFLLVRYQADFLARATRVLKSRDDAEDAVQDAFVRVYRFADKFSSEHGSFRSWALTILMNVVRTRYRTVLRAGATFAPLTPEHYESLPDEGGGREAFLARDQVERGLQSVAPDVAEILRMAYLDDMPYTAIAARLNISEGAVKTRVHRARLALRSVLEE